MPNASVDKLRVGVAGVGYLGAIHAKIYAAAEGAELVGVADVDVARAEEVAAQHGCASYAEPTELIGKVDAVSIVVPTSAHREVCEPFIANGIDVLLEKPVAPTIDDAEAIVAQAEDAGIILQIGHLERFNAGVMALAERVGKPKFIEVHRLGTFVERATDVDVVIDLMIHDIDIVLTLVRAKPSYISAVGARVLTEHVDIANARLEFENGAVANVTASRVSSKRFRRIRVFSEDKYHALNFTDQQIDIVRPGDRSEESRFPEIISERLDIESRPPLDAELEHFIDVVKTRSTPLVTGQDGLAALKVAERVRAAISDSR